MTPIIKNAIAVSKCRENICTDNDNPAAAKTEQVIQIALELLENIHGEGTVLEWKAIYDRFLALLEPPTISPQDAGIDGRMVEKLLYADGTPSGENNT